jgi:hypothetical protein
MRYWRAFPDNAREAVDRETPASWATCCNVTDSVGIFGVAGKFSQICLHKRLCNVTIAVAWQLINEVLRCGAWNCHSGDSRFANSYTAEVATFDEVLVRWFSLGVNRLSRFLGG